MTSLPSRPRWVIPGIMLILLVWGLIMGLGAYFGGANQSRNVYRALFVVGCMSIFLIGWGALLLTQKRLK